MNRNKTYIGLQFGNSLIADKIAKYSKVYYPNSDKTATHVVGLVFLNGKWFIYESTHTPRPELGLNGGARHMNLNKFKELEKDNLNLYEFYEVKLDKIKLDELLGEQYAMQSIKDLMLAGILKNNGKQKDRTGVICSEYMALANNDICNYFNLPAYCITPQHWYRYVRENNCKKIDIQ